jgi:hypothetical protein
MTKICYHLGIHTIALYKRTTRNFTPEFLVLIGPVWIYTVISLCKRNNLFCDAIRISTSLGREKEILAIFFFSAYIFNYKKNMIPYLIPCYLK